MNDRQMYASLFTAISIVAIVTLTLLRGCEMCEETNRKAIEAHQRIDNHVFPIGLWGQSILPATTQPTERKP